jgi:hypothetical protein
MTGVRVIENADHNPLTPCGRCAAGGCPWDRIGATPLCPDCQESLALGEADAVVERTERRPCAVCARVGVVRYLTYPLRSPHPVEIDLCGEHFHALLRRRLDRHAYRQLTRQLQTLDLTPHQVFLLHEAFYDANGRPLQPVPDPC